MAQFKCPECKTKISTEAETCPKCGRKVNDVDRQIASAMGSKPWYKKWWGIALIIFLGIGIIGAVTGDDSKTQTGTTATAAKTEKASAPVVQLSPGEQAFVSGMDNFFAEGTRKDAFLAFEEGIKHGDANCQAMVGMAYIDGSDGYVKDRKKGFQYVQEAADKGSPLGLVQLADAYADGEFGVKKNMQTAQNLMQKAYDNALKSLLYWPAILMSNIYSSGALFEFDVQKATVLLKDAEKKGAPKDLVDGLMQKIRSMPDLVVSLSTLFKDYNANEVAADQKYKGKKIRVTGTVESINKDFTDKIYIVMKVPGTYFDTVHFTMTKEAEAKAASLRKGQKVTIQGIGDTMIIGTPMLKRCWFPED